MFNIQENGFQGLELSKATGQFDAFRNESGLLPSFSVSFFETASVDSVPCGTPLGAVSDFHFYRTENGYAIVYNAQKERSVRIRLSADFVSADAYYRENVTPSPRSDIADLLYQGYRYRAATCGCMMIHAAAIVYKGDGILFCGMHEAGKSTQANLWKKHLHAEPLNYDQPCILANLDPILVHGSPWSGKEELYRNASAPLRAIVFVEKAPEDEAIRVSAGEAFSLICLHNYLYPLTGVLEDQYQKVIETVVRRIPVYRLRCTKTENAVRVLYRALYGSDYDIQKENFKMTYKVKDCFALKDIAGDKVVISRGSTAIDFNGILVLNDACAVLWDKLSDFVSIQALSEELVRVFNIDSETALRDTKLCIDKMLEYKLLDTAQ